MAKRKCANGGSAKSPQSMKDQLMALRPGYAAGGMPDQVAAFQGRIAPFGVATGATAPNAIPGINAQSLAASLAPEQSGAGVAAPVTAPPAPAAAPAAEKPYGNVFSPAGAGNVFKNPSAGNVTSEQGVNVYTPGLQTMAEKQLSAGINPHAAYRPGSAQDPYASGLSGVTAAQRVAGSNASAAALAPNQAAPQVENPMDTTSSRQRRQTRTPGLKDGGAVYRKGDTFSDRPMTGTVGTRSRDPEAMTPKPVQQIARPVYPQERQVAQPDQESRGPGMTSAADLGAMLANRRRQINQNSGMADGGMVRHRFEGKGGPRDDQIPVTVAGEKIKVSDGEEAVILPAKTAKSPQAIAQISDVIQQSNDGRPPAMGMAQGGRYAGGAMPHIVDPSGQVYVNGRPAGLLSGPPEPARTNFFTDAAGNTRPAPQPGTAVTQYTGPAYEPPPRNPDMTNHARSRTAAGARDAGVMSPEAAAFEKSRVQAPAPAAQQAKGLSGQAIGKIGKFIAPAAKIAAAADIGMNAYNSGRDGGAIQIEPSAQQMNDYVNQGGLSRFASAAKHGLTAGALNVGDAAAGVIDSAASLPNMILPEGLQIPSAQQYYRNLATETFAPGSQHGTATIRKDLQPKQESGMNRMGSTAQRDDHADLPTADPQIARNTGNANGATFDQATGNLYFTEKGYDPTKQAMAAGTGAITDPKTGRTIMITGAGVPENPNAPRDQYGNDMTQTLQARDSLMRQRQENALSMMNSPTAGYREAGQAQMRGLSDVSALDTAATRRAGDQQQQAANVPEMDRKLKGQQIAQGGMAMQQAQRLNDAADAVKNAKTAEEQAAAIATWRALNPKSDDKRFIPQTAKTYDNGMPTGEEVRMFDTQTQKWLSPDSPAALPPKDQLKIGQTYTLPQGPAIWRGNGFEAVK